MVGSASRLTDGFLCMLSPCNQMTATAKQTLRRMAPGVDVRRMRRSLFIVAMLGLSSCATPQQHQVTKIDIEAAAKRVIAKREPWGDTAYLSATQDVFDGTWRVEANALDPRHTECGCILFVPGTSRELLLSRSGRPISYVSLQ